MGAGPGSDGTHGTPSSGRSDGGMDRLFDRIASELADGSRLGADGTGRAGHVDEADDSPPGGVVLDGTGAWPAPDVSTQIDRPRITDRQCSRSGCADVAAVTLSYHYGQSQVWIDHLAPERDPHRYDLCAHHAARLSVPLGWRLDDRRGSQRGALAAVRAS